MSDYRFTIYDTKAETMYGIERSKDMPWREKMNGWIPISEQMPEQGQMVLFYSEGADQAYSYRFGAYDGENFNVSIADAPEFGFIALGKITHWLPLPAPPVLTELN